MQVLGICEACRGLALSLGHLFGSCAVNPIPRPSVQPGVVASTLTSKQTPRALYLSGHTAPRTLRGVEMMAKPGLPCCRRPVRADLERNCSADCPSLLIRMLREWNSAWKIAGPSSCCLFSAGSGCNICGFVVSTPHRARMSAARRSKSSEVVGFFLCGSWLFARPAGVSCELSSVDSLCNAVDFVLAEEGDMRSGAASPRKGALPL
mmetsp:Transcript_22950/g.53696  ORF Transcript_22950/g.53696 Transcript_22950/m.53696 type:complete len:207 (-) Transcript_22950:13-633(-)